MPVEWNTRKVERPPQPKIEKPTEPREKYHYRIDFLYFDDIRYSTEKYESSEFEALAKALREIKTYFRYERWCDCPGMSIRIIYIG